MLGLEGDLAAARGRSVSAGSGTRVLDVLVHYVLFITLLKIHRRCYRS